MKNKRTEIKVDNNREKIIRGKQKENLGHKVKNIVKYLLSSPVLSFGDKYQYEKAEGLGKNKILFDNT